MDLGKWLQENWAVIAPAIWQFVTFGLFVFGGGWALGRFMYVQTIEFYKSQSAASKSQVEALQERLRLRDDQLATTRADLEAARARPEEADKIVEELRERLAALEPYGLSKEAAQRMVEVLQKRPSSVRINIVLEATDSDPLYRQVVGCFRAAGWEAFDTGQIWKLTGAPDSGVAVLTWDGIKADDLATVQLALDVAGLDAKLLVNDPNTVAMAVPQIIFSSRDPNYQPAARWGG
ncbi:MAG: hypothetical protein ABIQ30_07335 [Devosia sp.]